MSNQSQLSDGISRAISASLRSSSRVQAKWFCVERTFARRLVGAKAGISAIEMTFLIA
jgi:hypothetical protein